MTIPKENKKTKDHVCAVLVFVTVIDYSVTKKQISVQSRRYTKDYNITRILIKRAHRPHLRVLVYVVRLYVKNMRNIAMATVAAKHLWILMTNTNINVLVPMTLNPTAPAMCQILAPVQIPHIQQKTIVFARLSMI